MHGDVLGLLLSVVVVVGCLGLGFLITKFGKGRLGDACPEVARKVVHIGVSNWFFVYYYTFESYIFPILGLGAFALLNGIMNLSGGLGAVLGQKSRKRNWGLVHYPLSVILMIILKELGVGDAVCVGCGLLGMGYGDGLAAIVGKNVKSPKFGLGGKTLAGSITMAVITFVIVLALKMGYAGVPFGLHLVGLSLLCAVCATLVEAFTPYGLDNISVPLAIYLLAGLI